MKKSKADKPEFYSNNEELLDELTKLNEDMNLYEDDGINPLKRENGDDVNRGYVQQDTGGYVQHVTDYAQEKMSEETNVVNDIIANEAKEDAVLVVAKADEIMQSVVELYAEAERLLQSTMDYHSASTDLHTLRFFKNGQNNNRQNGLYLCEGTTGRHFSVVPELLLTQKLQLLKKLMASADPAVRKFNTSVAKALARAKR